VEEVADAEDEEEPSGAPQARVRRQGRAGQARHEARGEEEARRRRAVEHLLEHPPGRASASEVRRVSMTWPCTIASAISPRKASM